MSPHTISHTISMIFETNWLSMTSTNHTTIDQQRNDIFITTARDCFAGPMAHIIGVGVELCVLEKAIG